jgi:hypothetical protein
MSGSASTPDAEIVVAGDPLPRLASVVPLEGRKVEVVFDDGRRKVVDLAPALESRRFYIPLRNDNTLFRSFSISSYGDAIEWDNGLDFSAVWLDRLPSIEFDNSDFRNAMEELGMTLDGMAAALQISRRQVADYRKNKPIPRHIGLAARYLVEHAI